MLPVEDIEGVCRSAKNTYAEDDNKAGDDGLSQVERSGVDLHRDGSRWSRSCFLYSKNVERRYGIKIGSITRRQPVRTFLSRNEGRMNERTK